jgi:hypothetical protein
VVPYHFTLILFMTSVYPNPAVGLGAYFSAVRLVSLALPAGELGAPGTGKGGPAGY